MKDRTLSLSLALLMFLTIVPFTATPAIAAESKTLELVNQIDSTYGVSAVVANSQGTMMLIQESYTWNVYLYNINTGVKKELVNTLTVGVGTSGMCFSLDGSLCAVSTDELSDATFNQAAAAIYDTKSGEKITEITLGTSRGYLAFDPDNNLIAYDTISGTYGYGSTSGIAVRDIHTGNIIVGIECDPIRLLSQNPADYSFASATWDDSVKIYNGSSGGIIKTLELDSSVDSMAYSQDGKFFAVSCNDKTIVYDVNNGYKKVKELNVYGRVSFHADSGMLVVGNTVLFADDGFNDYSKLVDTKLAIDSERAFVTQDGKLYINYSGTSKGIRMLDATSLSVRLKKIRLQPDVIEVAAGKELALTLTGIYSDGSEQTINLKDAALTISDFSIAKINDNLKLQGITTGEAELRVTYGGKEIKATVIVVPRKPIDTAASWAVEGINSALDKGIVPEDIQDYYSNVITRQEFCRMAVMFVEYMTGKTVDEILEEKGLTLNLEAFSDTTDSNILAAYALGITSGTVAPTATTPGKFTPDGEFNRQQAAVMIMNTCKVIGMDTANPPTSDFVDLNDADTWARAGVNFVRANRIMGGTSSTTPTFNPKGTYTRQESIVTFNNIK